VGDFLALVGVQYPLDWYARPGKTGLIERPSIKKGADFENWDVRS